MSKPRVTHVRLYLHSVADEIGNQTGYLQLGGIGISSVDIGCHGGHSSHNAEFILSNNMIKVYRCLREPNRRHGRLESVGQLIIWYCVCSK